MSPTHTELPPRRYDSNPAEPWRPSPHRRSAVGPLSERWWSLAIRGAAAIVFGGSTFVAPAMSLGALILLFGVYTLVDGAFILVGQLRRKRSTRSAASAFHGVVSVGAGIVALVWPSITALALLFLIAAWAVATGIAEIFAAVKLRKAIRGEWLLALMGVLSIALGLLLMLYPAPGLLTLVLWIGVYALIFGALLVGLAVRVRLFSDRNRLTPVGGTMA